MQLLGPVRCWDGTDEVDLGSVRQKAVFAVLALAPGQVVPVSRIVRAVWGDAPPVNGVNVVQKYVAALRRRVEPDRPARSPGRVITFSDAGYRLVADPDAVDAVVFDRRVRGAAEALRTGRPAQASAEAGAALAAWEGEALLGIPGPWFAANRDRLADVRVRALETWAAGQLAVGHPEVAVAELQELVDAQPLRERSCELLIVALHRSGRTAEALEVYRCLRRRLVEQTGLEPSPALRALQQQLLASDVAPQRPAQPGPTRPMPTPPRRSRVTGAGRTVLNLLATAVPLVTFGIATWPVIGLFAVVRRSVTLALAAAGYLMLSVAAFLLLGRDHPSELAADLGTVTALVLAFGGSLHTAALAFRLGRRSAVPTVAASGGPAPTPDYAPAAGRTNGVTAAGLPQSAARYRP